jgi:hypothetical protein
MHLRNKVIMRMNIKRAYAIASVMLAGATVAHSAFDLRWYTFDGGGTGAAAGGSFVLAGTVGQPDAGKMSGGGFTLTGGFWAVSGAGSTPVCEGDANLDGVVDPLDSGFVRCDVGSGDVNCDAADVNGDGAVDPLDAGYVLSRFGDCP